MKQIETPNLYLAAYLVSKKINLMETVPMKEDRVLFTFKAADFVSSYINRFHEGRARVEPRNYSLICKDLKAQASYVIEKNRKNERSSTHQKS